MLYEIRFEHNGQSGSRGVRARNANEALEKFREEWWQDSGDEAPEHPWIAAAWSEE